ncbi:MAG TPA: redoxin domain-containing protein [Candidatus Binataceae bacterium]|nr:redoxin domain-containing protein [Candidatus Binataceae bacterium]
MEAEENQVPKTGEEPAAPDFEEWIVPAFQPLRAIAALILTAIGFGLYEYVLTSFWSVPWMGIHDATPWPAYGFLAVAIIAALAGLRAAISIQSPHAKLGFAMLAFLACAAVGVGGGRFVSYTIRGTLNPPFQLKLKPGDHFPMFGLADWTGAIHHGPAPLADAMLIYIYRGDYCPFARFELADLTAHQDDFRRAGAEIVAISSDPIERSKMLSRYLNTEIPLLSDPAETVIGPLGLVQHHINGDPDNAIPAFAIVDKNGIVRWTFAPAHYSELPWPDELLAAVRSVTKRSAN